MHRKVSQYLNRYLHALSNHIRSCASTWPCASGEWKLHGKQYPGPYKFDQLDNFGASAGEVVYVVPAMVLHYVEEHGYLPSDQFIHAGLASPIPEIKEYEDAVVKFPELHERYWGY